MKRSLAVVLLFALLAAPVLAVGQSAAANYVRIAEDALWLVTFIVVFLFAWRLARFSAGGARFLNVGYRVLLISAVLGVGWKGLGLAKRLFGLKDPVWLFDVTREILEGTTGLVFGVAFILLLIAVTKKS